MAKRKALVIDNHRLYVELLSDILEEKGYTVIKAYDGMEALGNVREERPELIFVDLIMPKIDGVRFCKYVRDDPKLEHMPIVVLSATVIEDQETLRNIGADAFIPKGPIEEVRNNVLELLARLERQEPLGKISDIAKPQPRPIVSELILDRRHMELIIDRMGEGALEVDTDWRVMWINPAALEMLGKNESEVIGNRLTRLLDLDGSPDLQSIIDNITINTSMRQETATISQGDRTLKLHIANLIESGQTIGFLLLVQDITPLVTQINNLEKAQSQLFESAKFVALGLLAANISHAINNPLTNILGHISLLLSKMDEDTPLRKTLRLVHDEAIRTRNYIKELLNLAYQAELKVEPTSVAQELKDTISLVRSRARSQGIKILEQYGQNLPLVEAYPTQLKQTFLNIINNAFDAMPEGGTLSVRLKEKGGLIFIEFDDTGCGMTPQTLKNLFNPFFTTKDRSKRFGLGLPLSLGIIKRHRGLIEVKSEVGSGTSITLKLPVLRAGE